MRPIITAVAVVLLLMTGSACGGDDATGPGGSSVAGSWSGVTSFSSGYTTHMTLAQTGTAVSGTMSVAGAFIDNALTGTVDGTNLTLDWLVYRGCEAWSGVLTISSDGESMTGPLHVDTSGCTSGSDANGTLNLTKS